MLTLAGAAIILILVHLIMRYKQHVKILEKRFREYCRTHPELSPDDDPLP